jgi:histidinol-phosphatase
MLGAPLPDRRIAVQRGSGLAMESLENLARAVLPAFRDVTRQAGALAMRYFEPGLRTSARVWSKSGGSPVTEADVAVESMIRDAVHERFPGDGITGEEGGVEGASPRRWIVDPIDGTRNFADGIQLWGTLIALEVDGDLVVGVADAPAIGERYAAARASGATLNGDPIRVSRADRISRAFVLYAEMSDWLAGPYAEGIRELITDARRERGFGDFWGHMLVARGSADVMLEPELSTWDFAALRVIVEEAGGRMTTVDGRPVEHGASVLTTNGLLHDEVIARLASARRAAEAETAETQAAGSAEPGTV